MVSESSSRNSNESERRTGLETEAPEAVPSFMKRRQDGSTAQASLLAFHELAIYRML
jgi:hypothetical protein